MNYSPLAELYDLLRMSGRINDPSNPIDTPDRRIFTEDTIQSRMWQAPPQRATKPVPKDE